MNFSDERHSLLRLIAYPSIMAGIFLATTASFAGQDTSPHETSLTLQKARQNAQRGHPKVNQKLADTIARIHSHRAALPPQQSSSAVDLSVHTTPLVHVNARGNIQVYIHVSRWGAAEQAALEGLGAKIEIADETHGIVQASLPYQRMDKVAELGFTTRVTVPDYGRPRSGSIQTEGDQIINAAGVRALGFNGSGVKVGVISTGVVGLSSAQQSGDLPSVSVLQTATDDAEGTAMLEIVHDIAPGASLGFCGLPSGTSLEFRNCVLALRNNFGADIIVDDIGYSSEPYFEDGLVAQTVKAAADSGVFYTSAAGNSADRHYQGRFLADAEFPDFHDFGSRSGALSDIDVDFTIPPGETLAVWLQWSEPFGGACSDYDLVLRDDRSNILDFSVDRQNCNDDPLEFVFYTNPYLFTTIDAFIAIAKSSGSTRVLEMFYSLAPLEYNVPEGSIFGHPAVPGALAAGAVDASDPGNDNIRLFSSRGPSEIFYPAQVLRPKPDITAIDGVSVTGAGGFPATFSGTSAAAPHVAGVAALLMSASPSASAVQISQAIINSATDLGSPGFDTTYGHGRIDALAALSSYPPISPVELSGTLKTANGTRICAMVLASGRFMFSCNPVGDFSLTSLPRESDGTVKRQVYADGFFPKIDTLTGSGEEAVVMTRSGACPGYNTPYDPAFVPASAGKWINISGKVLQQDSQTAVCAMVLANGQFMFSCDGSGSYALNIPLDSNGQFKLQVYADGFAPTIQTFDEFQAINAVRMARAQECQAL